MDDENDEDEAAIGAACSDVDEAEDKKEPEGEVPQPDVEEAKLPKALRRPGEPSKLERDQHRVLHMPYRSWCKYCVFGKGNHVQRRSGQEVDRLDKEIQTISIDYFVLWR